MKSIRLPALSLIVACFLIPAVGFASPAQDQLKINIDKIMEILRDDSLKGEAQKENRRAALRETIYERFSFKKMSQFSLGRHWKSLTAEQQAEVVELFGQLLEQTYVSKIETYTNETVIYTGETVSKKKAKIFTEVQTEDVKIPIEYRMFKASQDNWMVYDIVVEGVSLVKNYRTQFDEILQKGNVDKLIEELKKKINS